MNRDALRYQLDGRDIHYDEKSGGFVVYADTLSPTLVEQVGACGGQLSIGTAATGPPMFLVKEAQND